MRFNKKELQRLGCTESEIELVLKCQKKYPTIFDKENLSSNDFSIDARKLYIQLITDDNGSIQKATRFNDWISKRIKKYHFAEDKDFLVTQKKVTREIGGSTTNEYSIKLRMAEHLCMVQNNENGTELRDYFCLMERIVVDNEKWWSTRNPQRANYRPMCEAISKTIYNACGRPGDDSDFSREANIINRIATGCSALEIKTYLGVGLNELTRDNLTNEYNEKIAFLQEQNILLLGMGLPIVQRVNMLISFFDTKYPDAKPLQSYYDREYLLRERQKILDCLTK